MPYKSIEDKRECLRRFRKNHPDRIKVYNDAWRDRNPKYSKAYKAQNVPKKYGISIEDYNETFTKQEGKCAICGTHQVELKKKLSIDHCHKTGKVRGLLCNNCNVGIGFLKEDIENLRCAILYLDNS